MAKIEEIESLFNPAQAPYTAREIADRLRANFGQDLSDAGVYRAIATLRARAATAPLVAPLDESKPALYSCIGAQRIARHVIRANAPKA